MYKSALDNLRSTEASPSEPAGLAMSRDWIQRIRESGQRAIEEGKQKQRSVLEANAEETPVMEEEKESPFEDEVKEKKERQSSIDGFSKDGRLRSGSGRGMSGPPGSFLSLIDKTEGAGNYSTLFGHSQKKGGPFENVDVSRMTIGELKRFSAPTGAYGQWVKNELARNGQKARVATPMGRYQFVGTTMASVARQMGLPDDTVFDERTQDAMFLFHAKQTARNSSSMEGKIASLRGQWEGLKSVPSSQLAQAIRNL